MARFRKPRGKYGYYKRGRWHWRNRLRRRRYRRRRKFRYARRRSFSKQVARKFFKPRPGFYTVRLPNPYATMDIFFQGIIFIPVAKWYPDTPGDLEKFVECRVATVQVNLYEFLLAVMPLDARSKIGGPCPSKMHLQGCGKLPQKTQWPFGSKPGTGSGTEPSSTPSDWWRWALLLMYPHTEDRMFKVPTTMTLEEMGELFAGWQLFTHRKTIFKVLATISSGSFSPVASLLVQNDYFARRSGNGANQAGQPPMTGMYSKVAGAQYSKESDRAADEVAIPSQPPTFVNTSGYTGCQDPQWKAEQRYTIQAATAAVPYSMITYPSFATLSALGAPWSFPPGQKLVGRGSFNKHSIKGTGDPQGKKWLTLVPKDKEWITQSNMSQSEINTDIGTLFLAQGCPKTNPYKFGTYTSVFVDEAMVTQTWAIIKVKSKWTLGNPRRPYPWDVNWFNGVQ